MGTYCMDTDVREVQGKWPGDSLREQPKIREVFKVPGTAIITETNMMICSAYPAF